jgi:hypothetical protein
MTLKLSLPHGVFSLVREMPGNSLLFENEATGQTILMSESEILQWLGSGVAKLIEPMTDHWPAWGRPEILITDDERRPVWIN